MALFNVPQRADRSKDLELVKKSKSTKKPSPTIKGGGGLLGIITKIKYAVEHILGKYRYQYIILNTKESISKYFDKCIKNNIISIDTETTGLDPIVHRIVGLCIYTPNQKAAYVPINHVSYITGEKASGQITEEEVKECLDKLLQSKLDIIMFNAKFDIRVIRNQLKCKDIYCTFDCMLAARLLNENEPTNRLKKLHQKYVLNDKEDEFTFDELFNGVSFDKIPINTGYLYAAHDAIITYELYEFQKQYINLEHERKDLRDIAWVFYNIEMPCIPVIADMEDNGIEFDFKKHSELSEKYHKLLNNQAEKVYGEIEKYNDKIEKYKIKNINHRLEDPINLDSSTQISILLYDVLCVESVDKRSPRGTGSDILEKIDNPICKELIKYRELSKLVSAFIDSLPEYVNKQDNRIHCSFRQYGAKTGRMSCTEPKLNWALV